MTSMSQQISAYFDGNLESDEELGLRAWLLESKDHLDHFVVDCFVHTQLIDLLNAHQVKANALVAAETQPSSSGRVRVFRIPGRLLAVAVSIFFVAALTYMAISRPTVVATVTGTGDVQWTAGIEKRTVGSLLQAGHELALDRGTLHVTFAGGGQVALHGPARFRVDSDTSGSLLSGSLSTFVPEHASGFTIHTSKLAVVDLGTEFYINLQPDESSEVQVFSGLVELRFGEGGNGAGDGKLRLPQGRAVRFDAASRGIKAIDYNTATRLPPSAWSK